MTSNGNCFSISIVSLLYIQARKSALVTDLPIG